MRFVENVQQDDSVIVHHFSGNSSRGVIDSSHKLWDKYQASSNITNIPYTAPAEPAALTDADKLLAGDTAAIRLIDDLIDALIDKTTINASDLALETMYTDRKTLRSA